MSIQSILPVLWFVLSILVTLSSCRTYCPRIFFQNINETTMPYKNIEGVYTKQNFSYNNFPVYRRENDDLLFYYAYLKGNNVLTFKDNGLELKPSYGVVARLSRSGDPTNWPSLGSLDRNDVFRGLVRYWQYYNVRDQKYHTVPSGWSSPMIKAVCVDEDFRECNSDRVYLNKSFNDGRGNILNDPTRDYFFRRQGLFRNLRPVYEHNRQSWYLLYVDGYWMVSGTSSPSNIEDRAYMRVKDSALRPEYITKTWSVHNNRWRDMPKLRVFCRGVKSMSNTCPSKPCHGKATCVHTSGNETLCVCPLGYTGATCSINKQCPTPRPFLGKELNFAFPGKRPGGIGMSFCSGSYPSVGFSVCVDGRYGSYWSRQGPACRKARYPRAPSTENPWYTRNPWFTRRPATRNQWNTEKPWWATESFTTEDPVWGTESFTTEDPWNFGATPSATSRFGLQSNHSDSSSILFVPLMLGVAALFLLLIPVVLWLDYQRHKRATVQYQYAAGPAITPQLARPQPAGAHSSSGTAVDAV